MFEVGMCVMTYTTVLFFEFLPNVFERFNLQAPIRQVLKGHVFYSFGKLILRLHSIYFLITW